MKVFGEKHKVLTLHVEAWNFEVWYLSWCESGVKPTRTTVVVHGDELQLPKP